MGEAIGKLHDRGLIHGDLETLNLLIQSGNNHLVNPTSAPFYLKLQFMMQMHGYKNTDNKIRSCADLVTYSPQTICAPTLICIWLLAIMGE